MLKELIGKKKSVVTDHPDEWVSFAGPDADESNGYGLFASPWTDKGGNHEGIFIAWNKDGFIYEVIGREEHYIEVIS